MAYYLTYPQMLNYPVQTGVVLSSDDAVVSRYRVYRSYDSIYSFPEGTRLKDMSRRDVYLFLKEEGIPGYARRILIDRRVDGRRLLNVDYHHLDLWGIEDEDADAIIMAVDYHRYRMFTHGRWRSCVDLQPTCYVPWASPRYILPRYYNIH